ncbi:MAG: alanine racemase [bacterium]|nr:alanine racemase [bacterium]
MDGARLSLMTSQQQSCVSQQVEVSSRDLLHNFEFLREVVPRPTQISAVVKANAYGHGLRCVAEVLSSRVDWFAVHSATEARELRKIGVREPILVMGFVAKNDFDGLDQDTHIVVSAPETLRWLGESRRRTGVALPVHIKVETGTNRQGVSAAQLGELCCIAAKESLDIVGVATHFANIEDTLEHDFAQTQLADFHRALEQVRTALNGMPEHIHAACSAAALLFRESDFSMIRTGISLYGHWPSRETHLAWVLERGRDGEELKPVLSWKATVGQIKDVPRGATVGYGRTWTSLRPTRLAVIPIGYSDGYPRSVGNRAYVLIGGRRCPVVGRVCMNIIMADVTDLSDVSVGDEVVLIGQQGSERIEVEEIAELAGTINYEILARLSPNIPRVLV